MQDWGSKALLVAGEGVKLRADRDICNSSGAGSLGSGAPESKGCCACLNEAARLAWKPCSRPFQPLECLLCPLYSTNRPSSVGAGCCQSLTTVGFGLVDTLKGFDFLFYFLATNTRLCLVFESRLCLLPLTSSLLFVPTFHLPTHCES